MKPIIEVKGLSKKYRLGEIQPYYTLRDSLAGMFKNPFAAVKSQLNKDEFWALKDINFEVNQGEVVGIIGRNGAGKSTLLKILSQITPPTEGEVILRGRVGSLLEVGTGFSPELTGRENIYLNGAVLGMKRSEVKKKFDEIVAFSEVEKFLDTPLKHYSSGMYMRLAFAVAAHLEPEILIVDEVLAVGDAEFQKKCLGKMGEVAGEGRTVLFVSHNMGAVRNLCERVILLNNGSIGKLTKNVPSAISIYLNSNKKRVRFEINTNKSNPWFNVTDVYMKDDKAKEISYSIDKNQNIYIIIEGEIQKLNKSLTIGYALYSEDGTLIYWSYHTDSPNTSWPTLKVGKNTLVSKFPLDLLNIGKYHLEVIGGIHNEQWLYEPNTNVPTININVAGSPSNSSLWTSARPGLIAPTLNWSNQNV